MTEVSAHSQPEQLTVKGKFWSRMPAWRLLAAVVSGVLFSLAFPPAELSWLGWCCYVPLLVLPVSPRWGRRLLTGYVWGYVQTALSLLWLNEVGFGAGWLLALYCACYPAVWYALWGALVNWFCQRQAPGEAGASLPRACRRPGGLLLVLYGVCLWVGLEWWRSWFLTGFPWNQLGICQFTHPRLVMSAAWCGVYGLSFLLISVNLALAGVIGQFWPVIQGKGRFDKLATWQMLRPWSLLFLVPIVPVFWFWGRHGGPTRFFDAPSIRVLAVQGNIPLCRFWSEEEFALALQTYFSLTLEGTSQQKRPDLILWPECAVPAPRQYPPYASALAKLQAQVRLPMLIGATDLRVEPGGNPDSAKVFNSALLYDAQGKLTACYDKIHRVPFGEYVPFGKYFPWLVDMIGMGRDLTPGRSYTLLPLPGNVPAGVNICFEDVFPEISRAFTRRGAKVLMTITNDSWYRESAGSRQHLSHVVFRAVECRRPLLRSGNNSDTCLIMPSGEIVNPLRNPLDGNPFYRGFAMYDVVTISHGGDTFYTKHGNVFAWLNFAVAVVMSAGLAGGRIRRHARLLKKIAPDK